MRKFKTVVLLCLSATLVCLSVALFLAFVVTNSTFLQVLAVIASLISLYFYWDAYKEFREINKIHKAMMAIEEEMYRRYSRGQ